MNHALLTLALLAAPAPKPTALPFIEDDYPRALAEAKARHLPIFADAWAPWCHTCIFMRAYVFPDPKLAAHANQFVWLSIDTEKAQNAGFVARYPLDAWPTLFVIDPAREAVALKWLGSANAQDLGGILDDGARAIDPSHAGQADQTLAKADLAEGQGDHASSSKLYADALAQGGPAWRDVPRVLQSLDFALQQKGDLEGCARFAREHAHTLQPGGAYANLVATGLQCAVDAPPSPSHDAALKELVALNEGALKIPDLLADDRSGIYETLVDVREKQNDIAGRKQLATEWLGFLEAQAAKAKTPADRAVFDPHRVEAAIAAGDPARALPALQQSERDLPGDYNAAAREALIDLELGKLEEALAANDRALTKVYGPRTLRVLDNRAKIQVALKRPADARATLQRALALANGLPEGQRSPHSIERIQAQLAELK